MIIGSPEKNIDYKVFCSVSTKVALTAAHCFNGANFQNPATMRLLAGRRDITKNALYDTYYSADYEVSTYIRHESYQQGVESDDIALIIVRGVISFNRGVSPICLPIAAER